MSVSGLWFERLFTEDRARVGRLHTPRGAVDTPAFMPVGTAGAVKAVTTAEVAACGAQIVLANTYHLWLRPGDDVIRELGGLHRFMNWGGPILTDSGGYQIVSLAALRRVDDEGVRFRSHLDGSTRVLTPERSMEIQAALGADIAMVLDDCPALPATRDEVDRAISRTTAWARRSVESYRGRGVVFPIVQGGTYPELRERSARELVALDCPGYAIGGVSVGEAAEQIRPIVRHTAELLPAERPRYLMGVGTPEDLLAGIEAGIDLFDCVLPTRNARNGTLFTSAGRVRIKRAEHRRDSRPLDPQCACPACTEYSRAYLRHLFVNREILASRLNTMHNLTFYFALLRGARAAIAERRFAEFRAATVARMRDEPEDER